MHGGAAELDVDHVVALGDAWPLSRDDPGYSALLDGDADGVACERWLPRSARGREPCGSARRPPGGRRGRPRRIPARAVPAADSDWDLGLYYRSFDPGDVRGLGHEGEVSALGEWGPIMDGGAWLTLGGTAVGSPSGTNGCSTRSGSSRAPGSARFSRS